MSESAHSTGRYRLGASNPGDSGAVVDDVDSADEREQAWDTPQEAQEWPDRGPSPEPGEPLPVSEEQTAEFVRPVPEDEDREDRRGRRAAFHVGGTATGLWIGLTVVAGGFAAIFFSWSKVAGLTNVAQQVPYLVAGGLLGLALVITGAAIVDVFVRRWDSGERKAQIAQLTEALSEVRELLDVEPAARTEGE